MSQAKSIHRIAVVGTGVIGASWASWAGDIVADSEKGSLKFLFPKDLLNAAFGAR